MNNTRPIDLATLLDHADLETVLSAVRDVFALSYPEANFTHVEQAFFLTKDIYAGNFPGYVACRTGYHDYRHTIDVFVATARLLDGCVLSGCAPSAVFGIEALIAALLHDVGYVQEETDVDGTGAKYTKTHVLRSIDFTTRHAKDFNLSEEEAARIGRLILGTDLAWNWDDLPYQSDEERLAAAILAAADLLGQMADRAYLEKLLFLYYEFREAGIGGYDSAFDILRKTASFYTATRNRLDRSLGAVSFAARVHFAARLGEDRDLYREAIERQMNYLDSIMADDSVNFRKKLRRLDLEQAELAEKARLASFGVSAAIDMT